MSWQSYPLRHMPDSTQSLNRRFTMSARSPFRAGIRNSVHYPANAGSPSPPRAIQNKLLIAISESRKSRYLSPGGAAIIDDQRPRQNVC